MVKRVSVAIKSDLEINRVKSLSVLPKQIRDFVLHYVELGDAGKAAVRSDFKKTQGAKLLQSKKVRKAISDCIDLECERFDASNDSIIKALTLIINANMSDYVTWDEFSRVKLVPKNQLSPEQLYALDEISESSTGAIKVKLKDKLKALESLAKIRGMFSDGANIQINNNLNSRLSYDYDLSKLDAEEVYQLRVILGKAYIEVKEDTNDSKSK